MKNKHLSRRDFLRMTALTTAGLVLSGCAQPTPPLTESQPTEVSTEASTKVPPTQAPTKAPPTETPTKVPPTETPTNVPPTVEPVSLTIWEHSNARKPFFEAMTQEYSAKTANAISFDIQWVPAEDYWTKLKAAIPSGTGPDIFRLHNLHLMEFVNNKFVEPLPEDLFPRSKLEEEFADIKEGIFDYKDGHIYSLSDGTVGPVMAANQKMWEEAGLTEADIPNTFDEMIEVAKKMTKTDASGQIIQPGFSLIGQAWDFFRSLLYQQGAFQFTEDIKKVQYDTPAGRAVLELIDSFYTKHKIASRTDLEFTESFGTGKSAMIWVFTWFAGFMKSTYPDIKYFSFPVPGLSAQVPAYGLKVWELSLTANANAPAKRKSAAWNFINWYFMSDEHTYLLDAAEVIAAMPQKIKLQSDPRITGDKMTQNVAKRVDRLLYMGDEVDPVTWSVWRWVDQAFIQGSEKLETVLQAIQSEGDQILGEADYWVVERNYKYANEFKG